MKWIRSENLKLPIKSWCGQIEDGAMKQAENLANHPAVFHHVALMPDCHVGYGMPIGGVIGVSGAVIPNAVGVDIGCGMGAVQTDLKAGSLKDMKLLRSIIDAVKKRIPAGEGNSNSFFTEWTGFNEYLNDTGIVPDKKAYKERKLSGWFSEAGWSLDSKNLGTLGGGNHFIEIQEGDDGFVWLMLHSGSRNLGFRIEHYYHVAAVNLNLKWKIQLPDSSLAYLPEDTDEGYSYIRDMNFALKYAAENRRIMLNVFKEVMSDFIKNINFIKEINIHHNYAALENHFGKNVWVHRKGATSAKADELGIIPGSMGTSSYIVKGLGNRESFFSCSHGAGRTMGRKDANRKLTVGECDKAMEGIVFDRWKKEKSRSKKKETLYDLSESPLAYKDIDQVILSESDLIIPLVKLKPLAVVKG